MIGHAGRGSNMLALAQNIKSDPNMTLATVIAPNMSAPGVIAALDLGYPVQHVPYEPKETYTSRLLEALNDVEWVCLAGFMKLVPIAVIQRFRGKIMNIHPALLPKFGGKGMYGIHVHEAVIQAQEKESGCTVHHVSEIYDEGEVILKATCPVLPEDTPETLAARVLKLEHLSYFRALQKVIDGE